MDDAEEENINSQLFGACEKGDLTLLKLLLEPPYSADMVVCISFIFFFFLFSKFKFSIFMIDFLFIFN